MTIGSGIFLSAILLSLTILFAVTKDRWKWKRLGKWIVGIPVALIVLGGLGTWGFIEYTSRPAVQTAFLDVPLRATRSDVRFAKGVPVKWDDQKMEDKDQWVYGLAGSKSFMVVRFKDEKVRYVEYMSTDGESVHPWLQSFNKGMEMAYVVKVLGEPSHVSTSRDGLQRALSYDRYNTFYQFEQAKVVSYGVFDPQAGPMEFPKASLVTK